MSLKLEKQGAKVIAHFSNIGYFSVALNSYLIGEITSGDER